MEWSEQITSTVRRNIGGNTYSFLEYKPRFRRCIDLMCMSQILLNGLRGKIFIAIPSVSREFSYIVTPTAKALEGVLLAIAVEKGMISEVDLDGRILIGGLYHNTAGRRAVAKGFVLKAKNEGMVDKIYSDWDRYRNKSLHYDEDFFVDRFSEAEDIVNDIYATIKLAYKIFIGEPNVILRSLATTLR